MGSVKESANEMKLRVLANLEKAGKNIRDWVYTYLFDSVSIPEVLDFGIDLSNNRGRWLTSAILQLAKIAYRIESLWKKR